MNSITIHGEECRQIEGFERYHVSESGRVYRTKALNSSEARLLEEGSLYITEKKIIHANRYGTLEQGIVSLGDSKGKLHNVSIARIVAIAFGVVEKIPRGKNKYFAYKDGDVKNLHYTNLYLTDKPRANYKLSKDDVKEIKKMLKKGMALKQIGDMYGVSDMQIHRIKTGENWGNGKRKIKAPEAPFYIKDGKIRRYIAMFDSQEAPENIKKPFYVKRNPDNPTDNQIIGILNGYKLTLKHSNITRAKVNIEKLNNYFFSQEIETEEKKIEKIDDLFVHN